ncbi:hypothetical protein BWU74_18940 [Paraburkholderia caledonica]|nr:hypothetical protein BWU74_18940 [Burkholderia sp. Bk]
MGTNIVFIAISPLIIPREHGAHAFIDCATQCLKQEIYAAELDRIARNRQPGLRSKQQNRCFRIFSSAFQFPLAEIRKLNVRRD